MSATDPPLLDLRDIEKSFGSTEAVAGVSASFRRGEYVCVLGPSGCGKTTLLRLIAGFEEPTAGDVRLEGRSLLGVPPDRRDVNVVFQGYALFPHLSVRDNVAFGLRMKRRPPGETLERTAEALRLVRMDALADRRPRQLSGGQQQRVALARALVNRPRVLLLDEPLSALDRSLRLAMQEELRALQRSTGVTFLHITHDQSEALTLADRLVVMRAGRFVQTGSPEEVYHRPRTPFVAGFLGSSNLLEGTLDEEGTVRLGPDLRLRAAPTALPPGPVVASVRPEAVGVAPAEGGGEGGAPPDGAWTAPGAGRGGSGEPGGPRAGTGPSDRARPGSGDAGNRLAGRVARITSAGPVVECRVAVGDRVLTAHLAGHGGTPILAEGDRVVVTVPAGAVVLLAPEEDLPPDGNGRR